VRRGAVQPCLQDDDEVHARNRHSPPLGAARVASFGYGLGNSVGTAGELTQSCAVRSGEGTLHFMWVRAIVFAAFLRGLRLCKPEVIPSQES
jgi:hypothetical protein